MIKNLNLENLWQICVTIAQKEEEFNENGMYPCLLGHFSSFSSTLSFEGFLEYYSFRIKDDKVVVFNDDKFPYEDFGADDFSYVPAYLLETSEKALEEWVKKEMEKRLIKEKEEKLTQKENIKRQIVKLNRELETLNNLT
jgi:hypothetical protein